jgi:hypothetical protein
MSTAFDDQGGDRLCASTQLNASAALSLQNTAQMGRYLMFFEAPTNGWRVGRDVLVENLAARWPTAHLAHDSEMGLTDMRDVGWTYTAGDACVECWSASTGLGVSIEGDDGLASQFAAWYRDLVPGDITIVLCDDMYTFTVEIPAGWPADEIAQRLTGS